MDNKKQNQWSTYSTASRHGYLDESSYHFSANKHHKLFTDWINSNFSGNDLKIIDLGCGNGRVVELLNHPTNKLNNFNYIGYDINTFCLDKAREKYKNYKNIKFIELDIEYEKLVEKADVIYIDSILPMFENPYETILELLDMCNYIFFNRTSINPSDNDDVKQTNQWSGMDKGQVSWVMYEKKLNNFIQENKLNIETIDTDTFILITTKNE